MKHIIERIAYFALTDKDIKKGRVSYRKYPYKYKMIHTKLKTLKSFVKKNKLETPYYMKIDTKDFDVADEIINKPKDTETIRLPFSFKIKKVREL